MNRFSGTVIPAPNSILLSKGFRPYPQWTVIWRESNGDHRFVVEVSKHSVYGFTAEPLEKWCTHTPVPDAYIESAILNVKAILK